MKGTDRGVGRLHLREKPDFAIALKPFILKELSFGQGRYTHAAFNLSTFLAMTFGVVLHPEPTQS